MVYVGYAKLYEICWIIQCLSKQGKYIYNLYGCLFLYLCFLTNGGTLF